MMRPFFCASFFALASMLPAQEVFECTLVDGSVVEGTLLGWQGGMDGRLRLRVAPAPGAVAGSAPEEREIPAADLVALHGAPPRRDAPVAAHLVGGAVLRGELRSGDADGETFTLHSPSLGSMSVPVDRLDVLLFRTLAADRSVDSFRIPEGAEADEAIFYPVESGFDMRTGVIYRFGLTSLAFAPDGVDDAEEFAYRNLAAVTLREGVERQESFDAWLLTRSGDALGVTPGGVTDGQLELVLEAGRRVRMPVSEVAALHAIGPERRYLSDLPVAAVEERAWFDEAADAGDSLMPTRMDRAVDGGFLVAGGRSHGKGVGTHSYSALSWTVPEGCGHFHARVALDDAVRELPVRGQVAVRVLLDGEELVASTALRSGEPALNLGLLPVRPGASLTLVVDFGGGMDLGDRVDWLSALFLP